jgi:CDP-diacylglycerol--glycerol-3-phosphate 3-phosphatidyltransferase
MRPRLPNLLTGARLVAVVPFAILLATADDGLSTAAAGIFVAASLTDYLDGYLARSMHAVSRFGTIADPLADRLLIDSAVILLTYHDRLLWWLAAPLLVRDAYLLIMFERRGVVRQVHVSMTGKVATATIMLALAATMLTSAAWPQVVYAIGLGISLAAGVQYAIRTQGGLTSSRPS